MCFFTSLALGFWHVCRPRRPFWDFVLREFLELSEPPIHFSNALSPTIRFYILNWSNVWSRFESADTKGKFRPNFENTPSRVKPGRLATAHWKSWPRPRFLDLRHIFFCVGVHFVFWREGHEKSSPELKLEKSKAVSTKKFEKRFSRCFWSSL